MVVVVAGFENEEVETTKSLTVWKLEIQIDSSPTKNGKSCPVGQGMSCNRAMTGNTPSIRGSLIHATRRGKIVQLG